MRDEKKPLAGAKRAARFLDPVLAGMALAGNEAADAVLDGNAVAIERESGLLAVVKALEERGHAHRHDEGTLTCNLCAALNLARKE